ncbi:MAG TPA: hypothetical protein VGD64_07220 [Acidisarcina sp.]
MSVSATVNSSPVAYVYVSNLANVSTGVSQINGYAAAPNGSLTPIPGSPFPDNVGPIAVNGKWLFGANPYPGPQAPSVIQSFAIAPNGALTFRDSITTALSGGSIVSIYLDHTGSSLYGDYYTTNNDYLGYSIDQSTGQLTYVSDLADGPPHNSPVSFIGNNQFAYSSSCYGTIPGIYGVQRASDGALTNLNINPPFPPYPPMSYFCPWLAAADPTNHLAIAMQPYNNGPVGPYQLATYTVDSFGNLTTASTPATMPKVLVGDVIDYKMSPDGKYLAVGGYTGLQIFHFNGANPITPFTGLLTTNQVNQVFWDNANHLYAISPAGKLYVFGGTASGVAQAPGSPYSIPNAQYLIVLPKTQLTMTGAH